MSSKNKPNPYSSFKKNPLHPQHKKIKINDMIKSQKNIENNKLTFLNSNNFHKMNPKTSSIILRQHNFNINKNSIEKSSSINNALIENNLNKKILIVKQKSIKKSKEDNEHKEFTSIKEKKNSTSKKVYIGKKTNYDNKTLVEHKSNKNTYITPAPNTSPKISDKNFKKVENVKLICEGNTSYIISCLYSLANIQKLNDYFINTYSGKDVEEIKIRNVSFFFSRILLHLKKGDKYAYSLSPFYDNIRSENCSFKSNKLLNPSYFLIFLLDKLHEEDKILKKLNNESELTENEYTNVKKYMNYLTQEENSFIFSNFSWINEKKMKCLDCKKETKAYTYFFTYDLDIESAINRHIIELEKNKKIKDKFPFLTIEKCIYLRKEGERIYNAYCDSCDKKTNLQRTSEIYDTYNYLIFLFDGIEQENVIKLMEENDIQIYINEKLLLEKSKEKEKNVEYIINSLVYYDAYNKEYLSYCLRNNKWLSLPDKEIKIEKANDSRLKFNSQTLPIIVVYELSNIKK